MCGNLLEASGDADSFVVCPHCDVKLTFLTSDEYIVNEESRSSVPALLKRGFMALEDGEWATADVFFERVINRDAEVADAYLGKLMAELEIRTKDDLKNCKTPLEKSQNYQKIFRFADETLIAEVKECNESIKARLFIPKEVVDRETRYINAIDDYNSDDVLKVKKALNAFSMIPDYKDSAKRIVLCEKKIAQIEQAQEKAKRERQLRLELDIQAKKNRAKIRRRRIALVFAVVAIITALSVAANQFIILPIKYNRAQTHEAMGEYTQAVEAYRKIVEYKDAKTQILKILANEFTGIIAAGNYHTVALRSDGTVVATGDNLRGQCNVKDWRNIVAVAAGGNCTAGLKSNGTVVITGCSDEEKEQISRWRNIKAIAMGNNFIAGLESEGTIIVLGLDNYSGTQYYMKWKNIVAIAACGDKLVGLKSDGRVVDAEYNGYFCEKDWIDYSENWGEHTDIVAVFAMYDRVVGIGSDCTIVTSYKLDIKRATDVVAVAQVGSSNNEIYLKADGTVKVNGVNLPEAEEWTDIVAIAAGEYHLVGLKSDGKVVATGDNDHGQCYVTHWYDIALP